MGACLAVALIASFAGLSVPHKLPMSPVIKVNLMCGPAPPAPPNCRVGACQCDGNGDNCQWTFVCS